jgi:hypothetical protein
LPSAPDIADQIRKLAELREAGIVSKRSSRPRSKTYSVVVVGGSRSKNVPVTERRRTLGSVAIEPPI